MNGVYLIDSSSGIGHTGAGNRNYGGNSHNPVSTGQRDGQVIDYNYSTTKKVSQLEKPKKNKAI